MDTFITSFESPGRRWQVSAQGGVANGWRSDGGAVIYNFINNVTVVEVDITGNSPRLLDESRNPIRTAMVTASPDSKLERALAILQEGNRDAVPLVLVQNWPQELER